MIPQYIRNRIEPHLKAHLNKNTYYYIDYMFEECYRTNVKGYAMITLRPPLNSAQLGGFQFMEITGNFWDMVNWEETRRDGELL